ncbi:unnamed protein product [Polarella glacialis]|uniref:Uncharacterized protein n=1 Tax=Polarella glacialis TaxID=89957 RepID=A0A813L852_POLGL|nr:unnamed protein product [Polarella glacialis]
MLKKSLVLLTFALPLAACTGGAHNDTLKEPLLTDYLKEPLLTVDIVHDTANLLYDFCDTVHRRFLADQVTRHSQTVLGMAELMFEAFPQDPITSACAKLGCEKHEVIKMFHAWQDAIEQAREWIRMEVTAKAPQMEETMQKWTEVVISHFESTMPKYRGLILKTPGNLAVFLIYFTAVLCVFFWTVARSLRLALCILHCVLGRPRCNRSTASNVKLENTTSVRRPADLDFYQEKQTRQFASQPRSDPVSSTAHSTPECCIFPSLFSS